LDAVVEKINFDLKQHQVGAKDWDYKRVAESLHLWSERFILEFKLQTSVPAIRIDVLKQGRNGHYRYGRNGFGLRNEIAIAKAHLHENNYRNVLGTLLHELLHAEQQNAGKSGRRNYHNWEFRNRAASFGLIVDEQGCQEYAHPPSPFFDLFDKYGIDVPEMPSDNADSYLDGSKLKAWVCGCRPRPVHIRVAIKDFCARCLKCNKDFTPKKPAGLNEPLYGYSQRQVEQTTPTGTGFSYRRSNSNKKCQFQKEQKSEKVRKTVCYL
jgi:hypothetical protein